MQLFKISLAMWIIDRQDQPKEQINFFGSHIHIYPLALIYVVSGIIIYFNSQEEDAS